jgi:hypothetical protein
MTEKDRIGSSEKWTYAYNNWNQLTQAKHFNGSSVLDMQAGLQLRRLRQPHAEVR